MFNKNSLYALNKRDPDAIVYPTADGKTVRITREDFPSEEEFLAFKAWSDENFHKEDNRDVTENRYRVSLDDLSEAALAVPAIDVVMDQKQQRAEQKRKASDMVVQLKDKLTETQFRRLWKYEVEGLTIDEIGDQEGVDHQRISKSILAAKKKIKKIFPDS